MKITVRKYILLRVRSKISYHAFIRKQTIIEHFLKSISNTYYKFNGVSKLVSENFNLIKDFRDSIQGQDF